jgi:hypothetical protein
MRIFTVWAVRKYSPDEPELVTAWDEYSVDANPEGFTDEVNHALESWGTDLLEHRRITLEVPGRDIVSAFAANEVPATIVKGGGA